MEIMQIGNGGAFDFDQTNSSFLIREKDLNLNYLLFDCGRNVIEELIKMHKTSFEGFNLGNLKYVYISHMDDDHIGSLKTLIYYMFFIHKKKLRVIFSEGIGKDLRKYLKRLNFYKENGEIINEKLYLPIELKFHQIFKIGKYLGLQPFFVNHSVPCYGIILKNFGCLTDQGIVISGDTTDVISLEKYKYHKYLIFQDYSLINSADNQVHCCKDLYLKFGKTNLKEDKNNIKFYHTGLPFIKKWFTIEDGINNIENKILEELKKEV